MKHIPTFEAYVALNEETKGGSLVFKNGQELEIDFKDGDTSLNGVNLTLCGNKFKVAGNTFSRDELVDLWDEHGKMVTINIDLVKSRLAK